MPTNKKNIFQRTYIYILNNLSGHQIYYTKQVYWKAIMELMNYFQLPLREMYIRNLCNILLVSAKCGYSNSERFIFIVLHHS